MTDMAAALVTASDDFEALKVRWLDCKPTCLDKQIIPALNALASHPGIVPVWSCSSHPDRFEYDNNVFQIIVAVDADGLAFMSKMFESFLQDEVYPNGDFESTPYVMFHTRSIHFQITRLTRSIEQLPQKNAPFWNGWQWRAVFHRETHDWETVQEHVNQIVDYCNEHIVRKR